MFQEAIGITLHGHVSNGFKRKLWPLHDGNLIFFDELAPGRLFCPDEMGIDRPGHPLCQPCPVFL